MSWRKFSKSTIYPLEISISRSTRKINNHTSFYTNPIFSSYFHFSYKINNQFSFVMLLNYRVSNNRGSPYRMRRSRGRKNSWSHDSDSGMSSNEESLSLNGSQINISMSQSTYISPSSNNAQVSYNSGSSIESSNLVQSQLYQKAVGIPRKSYNTGLYTKIIL